MTEHSLKGQTTPPMGLEGLLEAAKSVRLETAFGERLTRAGYRLLISRLAAALEALALSEGGERT